MGMAACAVAMHRYAGCPSASIHQLTFSGSQSLSLDSEGAERGNSQLQALAAINSRLNTMHKMSL